MKTVSKKIILMLAIVFAVIFAAVVLINTDQSNTSVTVEKHGSDCLPVVPFDQSRTLADQLDHSTANFASTSKEFNSGTTEGGVQITYDKDGIHQIVEQRFYKETGRSYARIYYNSGKPFALIVLNMQYKVPISVDNSGNVESSEEQDYYLGVDGDVCNWIKNDTPQQVDQNTNDMVKNFIYGVI